MWGVILKGLILFCLASNPSQTEWEKWRTQNFEDDLNSPTSFLNAISLSQALSGQSLFLVLGDSPKNSIWVKKRPKTFYAQAEHLGNKIRLSIKGKTVFYLDITPEKRRKSFKLANGAIGEVVFGKRVKKMWTYIYDPKQIKKFTGFRFFPYNEALVIQGTFKKVQRKRIGYKTVQGDPTEVNKVGNVSFIVNGVETYLSAYSWQHPSELMSYIALVFVDETSGKQTYGGGRELVIKLSEPPRDGEKLTIDFNKTMNFYCAHSPFWHCPVGLQEPIKTKIEAGEMLPLKKIVR